MNQPYKEHGLCNERCKKCVYHIGVGMYTACDYIGATGHIRPCPAGKGCTVFDSSKKPKVNITFPQKKIKVCKQCGKEYNGNPKQKYCEACVKDRMMKKIKNGAKYRREQLRNERLQEVRHCALCGADFHAPTLKIRLCESCRNIGKNKRAKIRREQCAATDAKVTPK